MSFIDLQKNENSKKSMRMSKKNEDNHIYFKNCQNMCFKNKRNPDYMSLDIAYKN